MALSGTDRDFLATIFPHDLVGVADEDLDALLDDWFAQDHFDDNPVYNWNESPER